MNASQCKASNLVILSTALFLIIFFNFSNLNQYNRIRIDAPSYYLYLPALLIYKDLSLKFIDINPQYFDEITFFNETPDGKRVIKHTMGVSVMLLPYFLLAHLYSVLLGYPANGYTLIYQNFMSIGVFIYFILALILLRKTLIKYFPEPAVAISLLCIAAGTNLLWYYTYEPFMSHLFAFSLLCYCLYFFIEWQEKKQEKPGYLFTFFFSLAILVRPLFLLTGLFFLLAAIYKFGGFKQFFIFLKKQKSFWKINPIIVFFVLFPQFIYYKIITGVWYYHGYINEPFLWLKPEILNFLFSFQKGWLIYTPVMIFAIAGLINLFRNHKTFFYGIFIFILIHIYVLSAWWAWNYQASFGMRSMIDYYPILSIPLTAFIAFILQKNKFHKVILYFVLFCFISLNVFQSWQYKNGLLHSEFMTKEAYLKGFLHTKTSVSWLDLLKPYNYDRRKKGLPQIELNKEYFRNLKNGELIYFRSRTNLNFISFENRYSILECDKNWVDNKEVFRINRINGDTISLQTLEGNFVSIKPRLNNILMANEKNLGKPAKFLLKFEDEDDNVIQLVSSEGLILSLTEAENIIKATSANSLKNAQFRIYHLYRQ